MDFSHRHPSKTCAPPIAFSPIHPSSRFVWALDKPSITMFSPYATFFQIIPLLCLSISDPSPWLPDCCVLVVPANPHADNRVLLTINITWDAPKITTGSLRSLTLTLSPICFLLQECKQTHGRNKKERMGGKKRAKPLRCRTGVEQHLSYILHLLCSRFNKDQAVMEIQGLYYAAFSFKLVQHHIRCYTTEHPVSLAAVLWKTERKWEQMKSGKAQF